MVDDRLGDIRIYDFSSRIERWGVKLDVSESRRSICLSKRSLWTCGQLYLWMDFFRCYPNGYHCCCRRGICKVYRLFVSKFGRGCLFADHWDLSYIIGTGAGNCRYFAAYLYQYLRGTEWESSADNIDSDQDIEFGIGSIVWLCILRP